MAALLIDVLSHYQQQGKYWLHEFVIMPDHLHLLITPAAPTTIEKALQFIKGGFSFRAKKELGISGDIWQTSFYDHRVRDAIEYSRLRYYIHMNPVRRGLTQSPEGFFAQLGSDEARRSTSVAKAGCLIGPVMQGQRPCSTLRR
jgi:putative transposase